MSILRIVFTKGILLLAACAITLAQTPPSALAMRARQSAISSLKLHIATLPLNTKEAVDAVPTIVNTAAQPTVPALSVPAAIPVATAQQKVMLVDNLTSFSRRTSASQQRYSVFATLLVISSFVLAFTTSVLNFSGRARIAGYLGLTVIAITGLSSVYPLNALASFYRTLAAQSNAILIDCSLQDPMPADAYNSASNQLKALIVYEGENYPQFGNTEDSTMDLVNQLQILRTSGFATPNK